MSEDDDVVIETSVAWRSGWRFGAAGFVLASAGELGAVLEAGGLGLGMLGPATPDVPSALTTLAPRPLGVGAKNLLFALAALGLGGRRSDIPNCIPLVTDGIFKTSVNAGIVGIADESGIEEDAPGRGEGEGVGLNVLEAGEGLAPCDLNTVSITATLA